MGKRKIRDKKIRDFVKNLKRRFKIEKLILFGSRAKGEALKESDYDFIIVSPDFEGIFFTERISLIYDCWKGKGRIEALCYTPEEFEKKKKEIGIVREALKKCIEII